jgi:hypothetical protein
MDVGTAFTVGSSILGAGKSIIDSINAKKERQRIQEEINRLQMPFYKIQNEYYQNRDISGQLAAQGLPSSTQNYYTTEAQRGLGTSINYLTQAGGDATDAANLFSAYDRSIDKIAAQDAVMKIGNIQNFMNYNKELAGQKTMKWALDEYQPYQRKLKELTERMYAAKVNQNNALNTAIGAASATGTALSNADLLNRLFSQPQTTTNLRLPNANPEIITSASKRLPGIEIGNLPQIPI